MPSCPGCNRALPEDARFCPHCGRELPPRAAEPPPGATAAETIESPSSRQPSSSSIHGRFEPGTRLGARYRIVGLLGRGGMGEVYRADDLELGQSVALKFLPESVSTNPSDLARLRSEVRTARQVAHPNVCRTYDISEVEGQVFVVMEYVDGEDLSSVLRRLGRPSHDKALEIARQLCLGLGAAHENGVLHRDLKPANIMIDGRGRVRITDFGLAGTAAEIAAQGVVAGTPGYMAPEQLRSGAHAGSASVQSDIYALGLVLYEIFTGKRAVDASRREPSPTPGAGSDSSIRTPSSIVGDVDPAVERVILRCVEHDPARRPQSAYAVFGALPGGDPLAAAVAAGETPSPELVANAGVEGSLRPLAAGLAVAVTILALLGISILQRPIYAGFDRPVNALSVRAEEILTQATGKATPRYSAHGYRYEPARKDSAGTTRAASRATPKPAPAKQFWRRWSPVPLAPSNFHNPALGIADPPQTYPGSGTVVMDAAGRLIALSIVPGSAPDASEPARIDWSMLFRAAGRDPDSAVAVQKPVSFAAHADTVAAWRVSRAGAPETTIVAAALAGRIVQVETYAQGAGLGDLALRGEHREPSVQDWAWLIIFSVIPILGSIILAVRNLKAGRGDVRGSLVMGISVTSVYLFSHLLGMRVTELGPFEVLDSLLWLTPIGHSLLHGVTLAVSYLAVEPYARRFWPGTLVSWARIVAGRVRDPIVGRDILIGLSYGAFFQLLALGADFLSLSMGLRSEPIVAVRPQLESLLGGREALLTCTTVLAIAAVQAMTYLTLLLVFRFLFRNDVATRVVTTVVYATLLPDYSQPISWLVLLVALLTVATGTFMILRYGFVAALVGLFSVQLANFLVWTTDFSGWIGPLTAISWAVVGILLAYGFTTAVAGQSLFKDPLGEPQRRPVRAEP